MKPLTFGRGNPPRWRGRTATKALIKAAAEAGAELELADFPNFKFVPNPNRAAPPIVDEPPSTRRLSFPKKPHMRGLKWSPAGIAWGAFDMSIAMAGDPPGLTRARAAYAGGDPEPLRLYLMSPEAAANLERAHAVRDGMEETARALEHAAREIRRTSGQLVRNALRRTP